MESYALNDALNDTLNDVSNYASAGIDPRPNRIVTVVIHVATPYSNGVPLWEGDAEVKFVIPAGIDVPAFDVECVTQSVEDMVATRGEG